MWLLTSMALTIPEGRKGGVSGEGSPAVRGLFAGLGPFHPLLIHHLEGHYRWSGDTTQANVRGCCKWV